MKLREILKSNFEDEVWKIRAFLVIVFFFFKLTIHLVERGLIIRMSFPSSLLA